MDSDDCLKKETIEGIEVYRVSNCNVENVMAEVIARQRASLAWPDPFFAQGRCIFQYNNHCTFHFLAL